MWKTCSENEDVWCMQLWSDFECRNIHILIYMKLLPMSNTMHIIAHCKGKSLTDVYLYPGITMIPLVALHDHEA